MRNASYLLLALAAGLVVGCGGPKKEDHASTPAKLNPLQTQAAEQFGQIEAKAPVLKGNPSSPAKLELGKMLFFEPRLSKSQLISCNSCHNVGIGGADLQATSVGHGWQKGPRNAPTVLNSVFHVAQFWDGRSPDLEDQAKGPVQAGVEMNNTPQMVEKTLLSIPGYVAKFKEAFPGEANPVSFDNMAKAIALFEATLVTPHSAFDKFLGGDAQALSTEQQEGLKLFMDKGCASCHSGKNFGGQMYAKFGVVQAPSAALRPAGDKGRSKVTGDAADDYSFRVPTLRNIALTAPYFHSGKAQTLEEAVSVMGKTQLGLELSQDEVAKIVAFLHGLTGEQPKVTYPVLPGSTNQTPVAAP